VAHACPLESKFTQIQIIKEIAMKKLLVLSLLFFFFLGCGEDGDDGNAYLSFTWDWYVDTYDDNNPDTPLVLDEYQNYRVKEGSYSFLYTCSDAYDSWHWEGTYTIKIDKGKPADFFVDGEDGEDNYYRLNLTGIYGSSFVLLKPSKNKRDFIGRYKNDYSLYDKVPVGDIVEETFCTPTGEITVKKQMYRLIKE